MRKFHCLLVAVLCAALFPLAVTAHEFKAGNLLIGHPWARATTGQMGTGAAYLTVTNNGQDPDRLVGATSPVATEASLHVHIMEDGAMKMRPVDGIEIAPGASVALMPGGLHIMLVGLNAPLKEGNSFPLILTFQKAGPVTVSVLIEGVAATHPNHDAQMDHGEHMAH
jgi:hypothetical protein